MIAKATNLQPVTYIMHKLSGDDIGCTNLLDDLGQISFDKTCKYYIWKIQSTSKLQMSAQASTQRIIFDINTHVYQRTRIAINLLMLLVKTREGMHLQPKPIVSRFLIWCNVATHKSQHGGYYTIIMGSAEPNTWLAHYSQAAHMNWRNWNESVDWMIEWIEETENWFCEANTTWQEKW